jgi:hypothetical protein
MEIRLSAASSLPLYLSNLHYLFLSAAFQLAHALYYPFKRTSANRLQQLCLSTLTLIYFLGVLLKTHAVEDQDAEDLGVLMVVLLLGLVVLFCAAVGLGLW